MLLLVFLLPVKADAKYKSRKEIGISGLRVVLSGRHYDIPEIQGEYVYNGTEQGPVMELPEGVIASGELRATDAGAYEILVELADPVNDTWSDGTNGTKIIPWIIEKMNIPLPEVHETRKIYSGAEQGPEVILEKADRVTVEGAAGIAASEYRIRFCLKDDLNTQWSDGTSSPREIPWGIYVCRIGEDYFTSVTRAFGEDRSTDAMPVTMLCNWKEEAVNESGTDCFYMDGYTLTGDGVTITNKGDLTVFGPGTVSASGSGTRNQTPFLNTGTLRINSGNFESRYSGNASGGAEVYGVQNDGGISMINGGTFILEGRTLAAEAICANGGTVNVNGGSFTVTNGSTGHGAHAVWAEGGTVNVTNGVFNVQNRNGFSRAFAGYSGLISVTGGTTNVTVPSPVSTPLAFAEKVLTIEIRGGEHTISGAGELVFAATKDSGTVRLYGGNMTVRQTSGEDCRVHGILTSGGNAGLYGGVLTVNSIGTADTIGAASSSGSISLDGGTLNVVNSAGAPALGVYVRSGSVSVGGTEFSVTSEAGTVIGIEKPGLEATARITGGRMLLTGSEVIAGRGAATTSTIRLDGEASSFPVEARYKTTYNVGQFWSRPPSVTVTKAD